MTCLSFICTMVLLLEIADHCVSSAVVLPVLADQQIEKRVVKVVAYNAIKVIYLCAELYF